jgi:endonuclease/exonuclease/phosphatase family metal-dependent hydrolase
MRINMKRFALVVLAGIILYFGITAISTSEDSGYVPPKTIRLATWNLEWFGAFGRSLEDIKVIASIVEEEKIDILNLQEITCECTLKTLAEELEFDYFLSPQRVPQKLALIWNPKRIKTVRFEQEAFKALERVAKHGMGYDSRQPLVFSVKAGEFDFTLINVHLKSGPENERSVEIRNIQYDTINGWLQGELGREGSEKDIIVAGDFNSYTYGVSSERLVNAGHVWFATNNLPGGDYSSIYYTDYDQEEPTRRTSLIDHIAITEALRNGEFKLIRAITDWDVKLGEEEYEMRVSDHLPVVAAFHTDADLD